MIGVTIQAAEAKEAVAQIMQAEQAGIPAEVAACGGPGRWPCIQRPVA